MKVGYVKYKSPLATCIIYGFSRCHRRNSDSQRSTAREPVIVAGLRFAREEKKYLRRQQTGSVQAHIAVFFFLSNMHLNS